MTDFQGTAARRATRAAVAGALLQPQAVAPRDVLVVRAVILGLLAILLIL